jgi:hypothetical protein
MPAGCWQGAGKRESARLLPNAGSGAQRTLTACFSQEKNAHLPNSATDLQFRSLEAPIRNGSMVDRLGKQLMTFSYFNRLRCQKPEKYPIFFPKPTDYCVKIRLK